MAASRNGVLRRFPNPEALQFFCHTEKPKIGLLHPVTAASRAIHLGRCGGGQEKCQLVEQHSLGSVPTQGDSPAMPPSAGCGRPAVPLLLKFPRLRVMHMGPARTSFSGPRMLQESPRWVEAEMARDDEPVLDFHMMNVTRRDLRPFYGLFNG